ncbi:MAG: Dabb family protein [Deltaproteobacteria bacterium]|nr:Dabb family protein [Deltaproteobacteria bacterium]
MIERLVLLSLRPDFATPDGRAEVVARAEEVIATLPQVLEVAGSAAADERTAGAWDVCLRIHFASLDDVAAYLPEAKHRALVDDFLTPRIDALKAFNFER